MVLESYECVLCTYSVDETVKHLFYCGFARECWHLLSLHVSESDDPYQILTSFRAQLAVPSIWKSLC